MASTAHDVGALAGFGERCARRVQIGRHAIVVVRWDDEVYALRDTCAHQGAPLSRGTLGNRVSAATAGAPIVMDPDSRVLRCPWHGWQYDICTGRALHDPARARVRTYPARVADGRVYVDVG